MAKNWMMNVYNVLPVGLQNLACTLEGIRVRQRKYGRLQKKELPRFLERESWTYDQLCAYRDAQLRVMIEHCYQHVPYYHKLFDQQHLDYRKIRTLEDLRALPVLTKQIVQAHFHDFVADNADLHEIMTMHTSGTTGSSFAFYYTKSAYAKQWAAEERYERSVGVRGTEWRAYFGGRAIVPVSCRKPPFYRVNYAMKEVLFSAFHMSYDNFESYVEGLERYKPTYWHGYPSSIGMLAQYMMDRNLRLSFIPDVILLASENASDDVIHKIEKAFGVRPLQNYAQTEQVAHIRQRKDGRMFVLEDLTAVELIPQAHSDQFRVLGTTLTNFAMPLIRYDTQDLVTYRQCDEGREILSIDGRAEDDIRFRDGGCVRRLSRIFHDQPNIVEAQILQKSLDLVEFHVVRGCNYSQADERRLRKTIQAYLADRIDYDITYEEQIQRTKNGKIKFVISEL